MFGAGAMTNSIPEIRDADLLFVIGSNTTEAHPIIAMEMKRAVQRGATLIVADRYGADSLGFISSSRCTGEENYLVQKLSRAAFGTNNCHQCAAT